MFLPRGTTCLALILAKTDDHPAMTDSDDTLTNTSSTYVLGPALKRGRVRPDSITGVVTRIGRKVFPPRVLPLPQDLLWPPPSYLA